jgi:small conductance mechanosensitive channel
MAVPSEALALITSIYDWVDSNLINIITTAVILIAILAVYRFLINEIRKLKKQEIIDYNTAFLFERISKWTLYILFVVMIFNTLGIQIDFFLGLWVLAGGTIIGFASMSTIGNAIAGIIIMVSRPFKIKDRLFFQSQFMVVEDIDLIYTRMRTLDNVAVAVPNQLILNSVIANQSVYDKIRRSIAVTIDYGEDVAKIRGILLSAVKKVEEVLVDPEPYVWITDFPSHAMEYTLFYHIAGTQRVLMVDAKVREAILNEFTANGLDMSTPSLIRSVK